MYEDLAENGNQRRARRSNQRQHQDFRLVQGRCRPAGPEDWLATICCPVSAAATLVGGTYPGSFGRTSTPSHASSVCPADEGYCSWPLAFLSIQPFTGGCATIATALGFTKAVRRLPSSPPKLWNTGFCNYCKTRIAGIRPVLRLPISQTFFASRSQVFLCLYYFTVGMGKHSHRSHWNIPPRICRLDWPDWLRDLLYRAEGRAEMCRLIHSPLFRTNLGPG